MEQQILRANGNYEILDAWFCRNSVKKILLVSTNSLKKQAVYNYLLTLPQRCGTGVVPFADFSPNPVYESVVKGVEIFRQAGCDAIFAAGGGSAIDVAKCIKLFSGMDPEKNYLEQAIIPNEIPFLAMPTTAGTGSEATRYAVIYYRGVKQSVTHESCIPAAVLLDSGVLKTLPEYQRKSTMLDALCHAIESFWSVNSTEESRKYSRGALGQIFAAMDGYLTNTDEGNEQMLMAANTAGKAINITQTTAGHAMCYKITSLFGCAHGHAAMLCNRVLFPWMIANTDRCIDPRGESFFESVLQQIASAMGCKTASAAAEKLEALFDAMALEVPQASGEQYEILETSVNPVRLKNHPVALDTETIDRLYHQILR